MLLADAAAIFITPLPLRRCHYAALCRLRFADDACRHMRVTLIRARCASSMPRVIRRDCYAAIERRVVYATRHYATALRDAAMLTPYALLRCHATPLPLLFHAAPPALRR